MTGITGVGSGSSGKFHRWCLQKDLQRGPDKSHIDDNKCGTSMAKGQKSREPVDHPSRSQQHTGT